MDADPDERAALVFAGGETAGLERMEHYFAGTRALSRYKETRNGLLGPDYSSKFSPWLAHGCLSPRRIHAEVRRYEATVTKNDSTYWLVFELLWREYFRWLAAKYGDRIFYPGGIRDVDVSTYIDRGALQNWRLGETGQDFIDANMRELLLTGFMSNRGRQNVASYLVRDLAIHWRAGAAYFESMLIDYDVYSNWGNWNYAAGVGTDPREDRYFNPTVQAERYDRKGRYVRHWLPERYA